MRTLITGVRVFDGEQTTPTTDVLIEGTRIATPTNTPPDETIDGTGRTLLPGLIDAHTHVFDGSLAQALTHGVTTELDMFCLPGNLRRQRELAKNTNTVADIRSAGIVATAPGGHPSQIMAHMPPDLREQLGDAVGDFETVTDDHDGFVARRVADGVDYLKVIIDHGTTAGGEIPVLTAQAVKALTRAGHREGLTVIAHAASAADAAIALTAGVDGLAHVPFDATPEEAAAVVQNCADRDVFVVTTLVYAEWLASGNAEAAQTTKPVDQHAVTIARAMHEAGVRLVAGTDANIWAPRHGEDLHRELELLVVAGLTPTEALAAATSSAADVFGLEDRGRILPGWRADLLLVDGDPTADITATAKIAEVWRGGERLQRGH